MLRQFQLIEDVKAYNPSADEALLNRAYFFGVKAHGGQTRASGEPYFNHPIEVAGLLAKLKLDDATIVTALLHDTLEDTDATREDLVELFGEEVAHLVDGVTKLSKLQLISKEAAQAENFRKLLMATARDPRVLLVKLADRLHNMRTIQHLRPEKRERIARETIDIFAPLAARMGMQSFREELEDLSFAVLHPDARQSVMKRFAHLRREHGKGILPQIVLAIKEQLDKDGMTAEVTGREKRPYAIWRKMQSKEVSFEQLSDIIGFRVLVATEADCYRALGVFHRAWRAVPDRFKDYISGPKPNGYRSIQTTVVPPGGARIEVQIRTHEMHEVAETGVAAHWAYKAGRRNDNPFAVDPHGWLRDLADRAGATALEAEHFLEEAKLEMSFDQVFCFSPKGDVIDLPQGATALDFAYAIHTNVGHTTVGAKINGKRVPLWTPLRNGQTVEILQSEGQKPTALWEQMVNTGRARAAIRRTLKAQARADAAVLGGRITQDAFERAGAPYSSKAMETAAQKLGLADGDTLLAEIGAARVTVVQALAALYPERAAAAGDAPPIAALDGAEPRPEMAGVAPEGGSTTPNVTHRGGGAAFRIAVAPCCSPLPGERVIALREPGIGFRLHAIDCETLGRFEGAMDRWVDVDWSKNAFERADNAARLRLLLANEPGALGQICTMIGASGANIADMTFADRKPDYFTLELMLELRDQRHLLNLLTTLSAQPIVTEAKRIRDAVDPDATIDDQTTAQGEAPSRPQQRDIPGHDGRRLQ